MTKLSKLNFIFTIIINYLNSYISGDDIINLVQLNIIHIKNIKNLYLKINHDWSDKINYIVNKDKKYYFNTIILDMQYDVKKLNNKLSQLFKYYITNNLYICDVNNDVKCYLNLHQNYIHFFKGILVLTKKSKKINFTKHKNIKYDIKTLKLCDDVDLKHFYNIKVNTLITKHYSNINNIYDLDIKIKIFKFTYKNVYEHFNHIFSIIDFKNKYIEILIIKINIQINNLDTPNLKVFFAPELIVLPKNFDPKNYKICYTAATGLYLDTEILFKYPEMMGVNKIKEDVIYDILN